MIRDKLKPLVSILIPCYNAETHLRQCIESALNQTYKNKEIILLDNESSDNSFSIAKEYPIKIESLLRHDNMSSLEGNAGVVRNKLFELANGEYIQYLDADDFLEPDKLTQQLKNLSFDLNISSFNILNNCSVSQVDYNINLLLAFTYGLRIQTNSFLFSKSILEKLKLANNLIWSTEPWQDFIILIDLIKLKSKILFCDYVGSNYRVNWSNSQITNNNLEYRNEILFKLITKCKTIIKEPYYLELINWYSLLKEVPYITLNDSTFILNVIKTHKVNSNSLVFYKPVLNNKMLRNGQYYKCFNNYIISNNQLSYEKVSDNIYVIQ